MSIQYPLAGDPIVQKLVGFDTRMAGGFITTQCLAADASANATTTLATVMTTKGLAPGKYSFKYWIRYQSSNTANGVKFAINFTGSASAFCATWHYQTTGGAASTGIADQATTTAFQLIEGFSQRTLNTDMGPATQVDTANADMLAVLEGIIIVTAGGDLLLRHASDAAVATTVKAGTTLLLVKGE